MNARANLPTTQQQPSKIDVFIGEVLPADRVGRLGLPAHIKPQLFERNLYNAIAANPNLMKYDARLVFREVSKAAGMGLLLDPLLGEAYLIEAYNYKTRQTEPQLRVGYRGFIKLARQSGEIAQIYAHEVCQNDFIDCDLGADKRLIHKPDIFGDRGPIIGYYAVVKFKDGLFDFEPMSVDQVHAIRDRSDGWKAFRENKIKSTPWSTDESEMGKKTTIRRLQKRIPQSPELTEAFRIEQDADYLAPDIMPPAPPAGLVPQHQRPRQVAGPRTDASYADMGRQQPRDDDQPLPPIDDAPTGDEPPPPPVEDVQEQPAAPTRTAAPEEKKAPPATPPGREDAGDDGRDYEGLLDAFDTTMGEATTLEEVEDLKKRAMDSWAEAAPDDIFEKAKAVYVKAHKRVSATAKSAEPPAPPSDDPPPAAAADPEKATAPVLPKADDHEGWYERGRQDFGAGIGFNKYPQVLKEEAHLDAKTCWLDGWSAAKKAAAKKA